MRAPSLPSGSDRGLDGACRAVEGEVSRLAKLVLHASALADRMDATAVPEPDRPQHGERVRVLRLAAEAGREAIVRTGAAAWSASSAPVIGAQQRR